MKATTDQLLGYYGLPSIFYETYISKKWYDDLEPEVKKEILSEFLSVNPHKEHMKISINNSDLYLLYLYNKHVILKRK